MDNHSDATVQPRTPKPEDFPVAGPNSLGSIGQRAVAWSIDACATFMPALIVCIPFVLDDVRDEGTMPSWVLLVVAGVWVVYQIVATHFFGATLGMLALGLRIARYSDGAKPDLSQASLRALLPGIFFAMPVPILNLGWVVVYSSAIYNPLRRGIQDQAGGTIVVRTR